MNLSIAKLTPNLNLNEIFCLVFDSDVGCAIIQTEDNVTVNAFLGLREEGMIIELSDYTQLGKIRIDSDTNSTTLMRDLFDLAAKVQPLNFQTTDSIEKFVFKIAPLVSAYQIQLSRKQKPNKNLFDIIGNISLELNQLQQVQTSAEKYQNGFSIELGRLPYMYGEQPDVLILDLIVDDKGECKYTIACYCDMKGTEEGFCWDEVQIPSGDINVMQLLRHVETSNEDKLDIKFNLSDATDIEQRAKTIVEFYTKELAKY